MVFDTAKPVDNCQRESTGDERVWARFPFGGHGGPRGLSNHDRTMIAHPQATSGVTAGNLIWEEVGEVALRCPPAFLLNVTVNASQEITGVFAGDPMAAHAAGCAFLGETVKAPLDIVVTTNSGYPLDRTCTKQTRACARPIASCGKVGRSCWWPPARKACPTTASMRPCWPGRTNGSCRFRP